MISNLLYRLNNYRLGLVASAMLVYLYTLLLQARSIRGTREACIYHFFLQQKYLSYINIINRINKEFVPTFFSEHVKNEVYVISKRILLPPPPTTI